MERYTDFHHLTDMKKVEEARKELTKDHILKFKDKCLETIVRRANYVWWNEYILGLVKDLKIYKDSNVNEFINIMMRDYPGFWKIIYDKYLKKIKEQELINMSYKGKFKRK